jgi:DNA mismatch repair protein MutS2
MEEKTLNTLEFLKVLARLADYASFNASAELARDLRPTPDIDAARRRQTLTSEARRLLTVNDQISLGGARDIRPSVELAARSGVLEPAELLQIRDTLIAARTLHRSLDRQDALYPCLAAIAARLFPPPGVVDAITRTISDRGDVLDSASAKLASLRRDTKIAHDRLLSRLERIINDPRNAPILQETLITQRGGRYVIPLRADFKSRMRAIVHDQSSSGATLFVEPLVVVDLNNQWQELQLAERDEIRRILADLSAQVGAHSYELIEVVVALAELDLALMCAKYGEDIHAAEPILVPFRSQEDHPGSTLTIYQARHPLIDPARVVPIDVVLDEQTHALIITGPNTGGKTVTLKTVGLLALMAQSGLHIPAQSGSVISAFKDIYVDIGDEQSIEQSLSTFSGHITNIIHILSQAGGHSLVLLDELGAGTDPQEGAALARALMDYLMKKRITCLVATHYPELKTYAHATPGVVNASMEFDLKSLRPTYHLTIGLPGRSTALLIAERLGLPREIITAARSTINPDDLQAENLLDEIHRQRDMARKARAAAESAKLDAEKHRAALNARLEKIEDERMAVLESTRRQAEEETAGLRDELDELRRALGRARQPLEALKPIQERIEELEESTSRQAERQPSETPRLYKPGDKVRVRSLQMDGVITSASEFEFDVQVGALRVRARLNDLTRPGQTDDRLAAPSKTRRRKVVAAALGDSGSSPVSIFHPSPGMELDLRGQRADDALDALDRYLESAYLARLPFVRIIHGKGTGALRQGVRQALRLNQHVSAWTAGGEKEGGEGVTVAHLHSE